VTAIVGDAALHGSGVSPNAIRAQPGEAFTGVQLASFTDDNPAAGVSDYSATIDWGDGTTSVGAIVSNGVGGWNVLGDHTYASECSCEIQVTGSDDGGATFVAYIGAYVAAPPPPSPGPQPPARNAIDFALDAGNQPDLGGPGCRTHVEHENGLTIVYGFLPVNVSLRGHRLDVDRDPAVGGFERADHVLDSSLPARVRGARRATRRDRDLRSKS
jgi:hypothetical protein